MKAETTRRLLFPAWASALRMVWTRQSLPSGVHQLGDGGLDPLMGVRDHQLDAAQAAPAQLAKELGPEQPPPAKAGVSASEGPTSMPSTSRRPSALTPTATITATETMRWLRRTLT